MCSVLNVAMNSMYMGWSGSPNTTLFTRKEKRMTSEAKRDESELNALLCCACGNPADPAYTNAVDDTAKCEQCAVAEYKAKHPLSWNMPVFDTRAFIVTDNAT